VALCAPSLEQMGFETEASTLCCKGLSACCAVAVLRMLFSHRYTSHTPSMEGACNVSRSAAAMAMFWLAVTKEGTAALHAQPLWSSLPQAPTHVGASRSVWPQ
jgi:hypothetical protein